MSSNHSESIARLMSKIHGCFDPKIDGPVTAFAAGKDIGLLITHESKQYMLRMSRKENENLELRSPTDFTPLTMDERLELEVDRFLIYLSRSDPEKSLPSRDVAREILAEVAVRKKLSKGASNESAEERRSPA